MFQKIIERIKNITSQEGWGKSFLIGGLLSYLPIIGHAMVCGYLMEILESLKEKKEFKLPKWQNFEKYLMAGLPMVIFSLVAALAMIVLSVILQFIPCFGHIFSFVCSIIFSLFFPGVLIIVAYRLIETQDWQIALNYNVIKDDFLKSYKDSIPLLIGFWICSLIALVLGCVVIFFPILYFFVLLIYFPMLGESYLQSVAAKDAVQIEEQTSTEDSEKTDVS